MSPNRLGLNGVVARGGARFRRERGDHTIENRLAEGSVPEQLEMEFERSLFAVVPSRWPEPFGMVGPEAMSRGRPVVAFDVGGIPDWLEDGVSGLLVPPGDINGLAGAMDRLLSKPDLAESLGQGAAKIAAHRLTHRGYLANLRNTLENVL